jgi:hypothetical protein
VNGIFQHNVNIDVWQGNNCVTQEASAPYAKHQNGVVEHHIQTIEDCTTVLLIQVGLGTKYWGEAAATWNAMSGMENCR